MVAQPRLTVDAIIRIVASDPPPAAPGQPDPPPAAGPGSSAPHVASGSAPLPAAAPIVLVRRKNPPHGWALPGGFVDYGETVETAAVREAHEETGLTVRLVRQFHTYSDPARDPRGHTVSVVFIADAQGTPGGADDAAEARVFSPDALPTPIVFDHQQILADYFSARY